MWGARALGWGGVGLGCVGLRGAGEKAAWVLAAGSSMGRAAYFRACPCTRAAGAPSGRPTSVVVGARVEPAPLRGAFWEGEGGVSACLGGGGGRAARRHCQAGLHWSLLRRPGRGRGAAWPAESPRNAPSANAGSACGPNPSHGVGQTKPGQARSTQTCQYVMIKETERVKQAGQTRSNPVKPGQPAPT